MPNYAVYAALHICMCSTTDLCSTTDKGSTREKCSTWDAQLLADAPVFFSHTVYLYEYMYSRKVLLSNVRGMSAISSTYLTLLRMTSSPSSYATWQNYDAITFFLRNVTKSWRHHLLLTQRDKIMTSSPPSYATWQNHDVISLVLHNLLNCCCFQDGM